MKVIIVGAGSAGKMVCSEILKHKSLNYKKVLKEMIKSFIK